MLIGIHNGKTSYTKPNSNEDVSDDQATSSCSPPTGVNKLRNLSTSDNEGAAAYAGDRTDSDQEENFSPGEEIDDCEDAQLNCNL